MVTYEKGFEKLKNQAQDAGTEPTAAPATTPSAATGKKVRKSTPKKAAKAPTARRQGGAKARSTGAATRAPLPPALHALIDAYVEEHTTEFSRVNKGAVIAKVQAALRLKLQAAVDEFVGSAADGILA